VALRNLASFQLPIEELLIKDGKFGKFCTYVCRLIHLLNYLLFLYLSELNIMFSNPTETIYGTIFHKLPARILKIINTPISSIKDELVFYGINNTLQELHLLNSKLSLFPKGPFQVNNVVIPK
jgi:hypothetical protein